MNKSEAIMQMAMGQTVTHRYFDKNESVRMRRYGHPEKIDTAIYTLSEQYQIPAYIFWYDRKGSCWETDWEIYHKPDCSCDPCINAKTGRYD